jgi:hypothetical protein
MPNHILPHALSIPIIEKLKDKRIVLASNSPRRKEIIRTIVRLSQTGAYCIKVGSLGPTTGCRAFDV